jgi:hypothetical protein
MSAPEILGLALFLVLVFALCGFWFRRMMRGLTALWAENTGLVQGTFSRWRIKLNGTWEGRPIVAYLGNNAVEVDDATDTTTTTYSYVLAMRFSPGAENWSAAYRARRGQAPAWQVKAAARTAERLAASGLLAALEQAPKNCSLNYRAGRGRMQLSIAGVGTSYCPDAQTFREQLDLLSRLGILTHSADRTALPAAA